MNFDKVSNLGDPLGAIPFDVMSYEIATLLEEKTLPIF